MTKRIITRGKRNLLVKIFSIDYQPIRALLRWSNSKVRHIFHHFLHAKPIQLNALKFFIAIVIGQSERESKSCSLLSETVKTSVRVYTALTTDNVLVTLTATGIYIHMNCCTYNYTTINTVTAFEFG